MNLLFYVCFNNDYDLKTPRILESLNEASRSLAELKGFANSIPNQHILINAITINEAKDSSAIENIVTTHDSIYKVLTESGFKEDAAKEVVDYMLKSATKNKKIKRLSSKSIAQYSEDNMDEIVIDQVYIFTKEENCTLEEKNCRIYLYYDVKPGDTPPPQIAVYYDSSGKVKKLNTNKRYSK